MSELAHVTDATFEAEVLGSPKPVLVDFYADWCAPCRALMPAIEEIAAKYDGRVSVVKLNVDDNIAMRDRFQITSIPALLMFDKGVMRQRVLGVQSPKAISGLLDELLAGQA